MVIGTYSNAPVADPYTGISDVNLAQLNQEHKRLVLWKKLYDRRYQ
jgi:hypothetical protein